MRLDMEHTFRCSSFQILEGDEIQTFGLLYPLKTCLAVLDNAELEGIGVAGLTPLRDHVLQGDRRISGQAHSKAQLCRCS